MENKPKICRDADTMLENFIKSLDMDTSHHRMIQQENKCGYGLQGICCRLCSNGPCRISPARPKGVCGANADTIAIRNFLRSIAAGSGCYIHVLENAAGQLLKIAKAKKPIKSEKALLRLANLLDIKGEDNWEKAENIAQAVREDLYLPVEEKMKLVEKIAYPVRIGIWKKLGILPGGAKNEVFNAVVKTSTNLNSDPVNMLMQCLRLGISTGVYGLVLTNLINDILMGEGEIGFDPVGLRVLDPACVNIMITGHQHTMFGDLEEYMNSEEVRHLAKQAGAKAVRIIGCTCVGQDFQLRKAAGSDVFCGHAGNNYTSEAALATGCVDLVVSEFNCTLPGIEPICDSLKIPQICLDDVAKKSNAEYEPYSYEEKRKISEKIVSKAIESYKDRAYISNPQESAEIFRKALATLPSGELSNNDLENLLKTLMAEKENSRKNPMALHGCDEAITGVTEVSLKQFLGGSYDKLIELIQAGKIKGIAGIVGCSNLRAKGHDVYTVELAKEMIKRDILVVSAGCTSGGLENCGLMSREAAKLAGSNLRSVCESLGIPPVLNFGPCLAIGRIELVAGEIAHDLGIDIPQLPIVISAPQWLEEQALADGAFALALGFTLHLGLAPFITGSPVALEVLTEQMKTLTGGCLMVNTDVAESASAMEQVIMEKRESIGI